MSKPMSVKEISAKADFDFNPFIAMKYWFRTADTLLREVWQFYIRTIIHILTTKGTHLPR